ncbi:hypothetical protein ACFV0O_04285 [Kitasatospora sp. NPDC059577]|uniref:hypothetical protein n=1 Tax=Kitasatospora sp. NPDC059577 TaxID=3346873 RepID=UPI00367949C4
MFTEDQLNQLTKLLAPLLEGQGELRSEVGEIKREVGGLRQEVGDLKHEVAELRADFNGHVRQSKQDHEELLKAVISVGDAIHDKVEHQDKRITRVEKHLNLTPLD